MAQLVEHQPLNLEVVGLSPTWENIFPHVCVHFGIHGWEGNSETAQPYAQTWLNWPKIEDVKTEILCNTTHIIEGREGESGPASRGNTGVDSDTNSPQKRKTASLVSLLLLSRTNQLLQVELVTVMLLLSLNPHWERSCQENSSSTFVSQLTHLMKCFNGGVLTHKSCPICPKLQGTF